MRTRTMIGVSAALFVALAIYVQDFAAVYVAAGVHALAYLLHAIEVKLNKLLDHYGISVPDWQIAKD